MAGKRPIEIVLNSEYNNKDINRAINDLNSLKKQAGGTTPMMSGLGKAIMGMAAGFMGLQGLEKLKDFMLDAAKAAMEDETSVKRLDTAMRNLNLAAAIPNVQRGIDAMSRQYGVADDQLRPSMQKLLQATGDVDTAQSALATAMDISAGTGRDLGTVSQALSRAYAGNTAGLSRLGVPLDKTLLASKDMVAIQGELNRVFGGQAQAATHTYAGQMAKLNVALDEAKEAIGYALLQSVTDLSNALGGSGGATEAIQNFGVQMSNIVRGFGEFTVGLATAAKAVHDWAAQVGFSEEQVSGFGSAVKEIFLWANPLLNAIESWRTSGAEANKTTQEMNDSLRASEGYMQSYIASVDPASAALLRMKNASEDAADEQAQLASALEDVKAGLSLWAAIDAYNAKLREIRTLSEDGSRALLDHGKAADKNSQMIRDAFESAANRVSLWAKENSASADEIEAKYQTFATNIRKTLIAAGFDEGDIDKLLGKYNLWDAKAAGIVDAVTTGGAGAEKAGKGIGRDFSRGVGLGILLEQARLDLEARRMVFSAEQAGRDAAKSSSPSKLFAELGKDLVKGTIKGVRDEIQTRRDALKSMYQDWYNTTLAGKEAARDQAQQSRDNYETSIVQPLRDALKTAQETMKNYKDNVKSSITGAISFGSLQPTKATVDSEGNETAAATTFMQNLKAKAEQAVAFAAKVKQLISMGLSEAGISQVLAAGADAGTAIADELINGGVSAITQTNDLMNAVSTAATSTADTAGATFYQSGVDLATNQLAGAESQLTSFYQAGVDNAQAAIDGFNATYGADSGKYGKYFDQPPTFKDFTAAADDFEDFKDAAGKLIKKKKKKKAKGKASGGYVSADTAYFVGEEGPELFVPSTAGSIIPAGQSGGNTYKITVQAGVGDPRQIGQSVVEYIKRFEKANGPVFAKAG